jgi:glucosamine--fructose-6-phosphate aminotransferase (isomerizing)
MCGIVGYIGPRPAVDFLLAGLRRLEYRGYDSAGVATVAADGRICVTKTAGRIDDLSARLAGQPVSGDIGIGHTRWATHGPPTDDNAHPHFGGSSAVTIVHNGVIENYRKIRRRLEAEGYEFRSATDTEAIAHLLADCLAREQTAGPQPGDDADPHAPLIRAVQAALAQLRGT